MSVFVAGHEMSDGEAEAILAILKSEAGTAYKKLLESLAEQARCLMAPRGTTERETDVYRGHLEILANILNLDVELSEALESQKREVKKDA